MMHDGMPNLMLGMFWGGVVLMLPPVLLACGIVAYILQRHRAERDAAPRDPPLD
jgi:hypothetical protein